MVDSIIADLKGVFRSGNMISRLIIINVIVFMVLNLIKVFDYNQSLFPFVEEHLAMTSDLSKLIFRPWVIVTHMFMHVSFWHILWNMLLLYWFGRIVGDLLGDRRILPLYFMSALFGAMVYVIWDQFLPGGSDGLAVAYGASGAVMAFIFAAATVAPDYIINLLLIGPVRLRYVALGLLFLDLISNGTSNRGGFIVHLAGVVFGVLFVVMLRRGTDLTDPFNKSDRKRKIKKTSRKSFKVVHNVTKEEKSSARNSSISTQDRLDRILDRINEVGYDNLSQEEKDFLKEASE